MARGLPETLSTADPVLAALPASMPGPLAEGARGRDLCMVSGCPAQEAQRKVVGPYSPPGVTPELGASAVGRACPQLTAGSKLGLRAGEHGQRYDFLMTRATSGAGAASGWSAPGWS